MRLTRAALRAEATATPDNETIDASKLHIDPKDRAPLREVVANASPESNTTYELVETVMPLKQSKAKGGAKKGAKGKKAKAAEKEQVEVDTNIAEVLEDERLAAGSPASDAAVEDLSKPPTDDIIQIPMADQQPASPPSRAVRMTRRQIAKQEEELSRGMQAQSLPDRSNKHFMTTPKKIESYPDEIVFDDDLPIADEEEAVAGAQEEPTNPQELLPVPTVEEPVHVVEDAAIAPVEETPQAQESTNPSFSIDHLGSPALEPKTLASERPSDSLSQASTPIQSRRPSCALSRTSSRSPMRLEASIEAIDALEEALENVGRAIPNLDNNSGDEKSPRKARFAAADRLKNENMNGTPARKSSTRVSKNPGGEVKSLKPPSRAPTMTRTSLARSQSTRVAPRPERKGTGQPTDYLATKRRPISITFPAPPPPQKSAKAPTKSTFQLPGEAVAAKLKAQREERQKKEAGDQASGGSRPKSAIFSGPAVVKSTKPLTKSNFQLPGEAIAAKLKAQKEERLEREAEEAANGVRRPQSAANFVAPPVHKSTKPPTKANFQLPGEAIAAKLKAQREERLKREEEERAAAEAEKKASLFRARSAPPKKNVPSMVVRQTAASRARENLMNPEASVESDLSRSSSVNGRKPRPNSVMLSRTSSTSNSTTASKRSSVIVPGPVSKSTVTATDVAAQRMKARQIFNRDQIENEQLVRDRKEKEEAAKRARAQAAERGRIASREWAERQRKKLMGGGGGAPLAANGTGAA